MWRPLILALLLLSCSVLYGQSSPESLGPVTLAPEEYQAIEKALTDSSATLTLAKQELTKLKASLATSAQQVASLRKLVKDLSGQLATLKGALIKSATPLTQALTRIDKLSTSCAALEDEIDKLSAQVWIAGILAFLGGLGLGFLVGRLSATF
jgi:septal ring factor EnvC (AmiA/AmiB activator)